MSAPLLRKHPPLNKLPYTDKSLLSNKRPYSNERAHIAEAPSSQYLFSNKRPYSNKLPYCITTLISKSSLILIKASSPISAPILISSLIA